MQDEFETKLRTDGFTVVSGKRRDALLLLDQDGIRTEDGPRLSWRHVSLRRDDADGALLVVGRDATYGSTDEAFLRTLESAAGNDLDRQLAKVQGLKTGFKGSQSIGCVIFFGLFVWAVSSIPGCYRGAVDATIDTMPYEVDEALGEAAQESMQVGSEVDDEVVVDAITAMVDRLSEHFEGTDVSTDQVTWTVRVVENEMINAFALPGGYITVFTGLIENAEEPDMVAGVLAHEMIHVLQRHGLKRVGNQIGMMAGVRLIFGDAGGLIGIARELFTIATVNDYGRDQETEADLLGAGAMVRAGLDADQLAQFFLLLERESGASSRVPEILATHPDLPGRALAVRELAEEMDAVELRPLEIDWADVRVRVGADD